MILPAYSYSDFPRCTPDMTSLMEPWERHLLPSKHLRVISESSQLFMGLVLALCSPSYDQHIFCSHGVRQTFFHRPMLSRICHVLYNVLLAFLYGCTFLTRLPPYREYFAYGRGSVPLIRHSPHTQAHKSKCMFI